MDRIGTVRCFRHRTRFKILRCYELTNKFSLDAISYWWNRFKLSVIRNLNTENHFQTEETILLGILSNCLSFGGFDPWSWPSFLLNMPQMSSRSVQLLGNLFVKYQQTGNRSSRQSPCNWRTATSWHNRF